MKKYDLQDRLITFSIDLINLLEKLPKTVIGKHLKGQLTRSGTSPALNYAEACDEESRKDFLHKIKIVLKELRETYVGFRIISGLNLPSIYPDPLIKKCDELIAIFKQSYYTTKANMENEMRQRKRLAPTN